MSKKFEYRKVPASALRFEGVGAVAVDLDGDKKTFSLNAYSGQVFDHPWWGKIAFDVSSMEMRKKVIPARIDHDSNKNAGVITEMMKEGLDVNFNGEFIENEHTAELFAMQEKGLEYECSVAFDDSMTNVIEVGENATMEVNGAEFTGPGVVMQGPIHEVSFTHYGAVPGTETDFSKDSKKDISVKVFSNFNQEECMSKEFTQEDLDNQRAQALSEFKALRSKMVELCDDKAFAADCMERDLSFEQFQSELIAKLQGDVETKDAEIAEFKANADAGKDDSGRPDGVEFSDSESDSGEKNFTELVDDVQKGTKLSRRQAFSAAIRKYPEEYKAHKAGFTRID